MLITAGAEKARSISDADSSAYHATHLEQHINTEDCCVTGNYIKVRSAAKTNAKVLGHVEQADTFVLVDVSDGLACIRVISAHSTSPDSWVGLEGWVSTDYVDCVCSPSAYSADNGAGYSVLTQGFFPYGMPREWCFSSGAGAWSTMLWLNEDGSFTGYYHDWDAGAETCPHGELQECSFRGQFGKPKQVSEFEYVLWMEELTCEAPAGQQFVRDEMLVTTTSAYGCGEDACFVIYLPGTPEERIPQAYMMWAWDTVTDDGLAGFALYNMSQAFGFTAPQ